MRPLAAAHVQDGTPPELLSDLKGGLNPISRFDFGRLKALRYASEWQAK
jgi:hypothetical protein